MKVAELRVKLNPDNGLRVEAVKRRRDRLHVIGHFIWVRREGVVQDEGPEGTRVIKSLLPATKAAAGLLQAVNGTLDVGAVAPC